MSEEIHRAVEIHGKVEREQKDSRVSSKLLCQQSKFLSFDPVFCFVAAAGVFFDEAVDGLFDDLLEGLFFDELGHGIVVVDRV